MKRPPHLLDVLVIGFALFSMFFGAGNVIFPPYLGLQSGPQWIIGFLFYYIADIGLALLALFAVLQTGSSESITEPIGHLPSTLLLSSIILCIGPMLAIPRTAATTFEMSILPLFPNVSPYVFSGLFFLMIFLLCVKESAVVDIVGKVLTPALLLGLLVLIFQGVLHPIGPVASAVPVENVPVLGIDAGYQTMDVLAAIIFGIIVLKSAENKGYETHRDRARVVAGAGFVAGLILLVVYMGLTYLGATTGTLFDLSVNRSVLIISIVHQLLGSAGTVIFAVVVALACITTAVALVSASASYFSDLSHKRLSYELLAAITCAFSAVAATVGLDQIIAIAAPILNIVYPPALALVCLSFFRSRIRNLWVFRFATLGAFLVGLFSVLAGYDIPALAGVAAFLKHLPFSSLGFNWVVPALVFGVVGALVPWKKELEA